MVTRLGECPEVVKLGQPSECCETEDDPRIADWPLATTRYYALDYDNGDDSNQGWSNVSMAEAGTWPVKTWQHLLTIIPTVGAGRLLVVAIKPRAAGATYRNIANSADDDLIVSWTGYRRWLVRATTDFSDNTADQRTLGAIVQSAGPNGDGSWTCAAGGTVAAFAIAAGALPAADAARYFRVRFKGNVTAALLNQCQPIHTYVAGAGGTIVPSEDLPAAPAAGDEFFIEKCGVAFGTVTIGAVSAVTTPGSTDLTTLGIAGVASTGAGGFRVKQCPGSINVAFCESRGTGALTASLVGRLELNNLYVNIAATQLSNIGFGFRSAATFSFFGCTFVQARNIGAAGTGVLSMTTCLGASLGRSSWLRAGLSVLTSGGNNRLGTATSQSLLSIGEGGVTAVTTRRPLTVDLFGASAGMEIVSCSASIGHATITNMGANPAILARGQGLAFSVDAVTGSTGNTDVGIDLSQVLQSEIALGRIVANTVTGAAGDIRRAGPAIITHASLTAAEVRDVVGNLIIGTGGVQVMKFSAGTLANAPVLGADPGAPVDGDIWVTDIAGARKLCVRIAGTTYRATLV